MSMMLRDVDEQVNLVELALGNCLYLMQFAGAAAANYYKMVVPLDKSPEAESVLPQVQKMLASNGVGILLHVIYPRKDREPNYREQALEYLHGVAYGLGGKIGQWQCEVIEANSVAEGIANFAADEQVELIAMFTHDRKGLTKLLKGSIAERVRDKASTPVHIFKPREMTAVS
jgi:nucleotide-binding universal stress UspA family protein